MVGPRFSFLHVEEGLAGSNDALLVFESLPGVLLCEDVDVGLADRHAFVHQVERPHMRLADVNEATLDVLE